MPLNQIANQSHDVLKFVSSRIFQYPVARISAINWCRNQD